MSWKSLIVFASVFLVGLAVRSVDADEQVKRVSTDQLLVKAQRICPVTGKDLLSMGGPVRAEFGGVTVFLCCKGCFGRPLNKKHWATVQANVVKAQGQCPIFKKPLGKHPVPVVVNHRLLFVCCKPCTKKVEADPERSIAFVNVQLARRFAKPKR